MTADAELDEMERQLKERRRVQAAYQRRRVQEWLQSRPVVARVRKATPPDGFAGWWHWEVHGWRRVGYGYCEDHRSAVIVAASAARAFAAEVDTEEPPHA